MSSNSFRANYEPPDPHVQLLLLRMTLLAPNDPELGHLFMHALLADAQADLRRLNAMRTFAISYRNRQVHGQQQHVSASTIVRCLDRRIRRAQLQHRACKPNFLPENPRDGDLIIP